MKSLTCKKRAYEADKYWMQQAVKRGLAESTSPIDKKLVAQVKREYQAAWTKENRLKQNEYQRKYYAGHQKKYKETQDRYWMRKAVAAGMAEFEYPINPYIINALKREYYHQRKQSRASSVQ